MAKLDITPAVSPPLTVPLGGTGATTLTGLVKGNGASAMTAVTAPSGAVVGNTDTQTLTNKTIVGGSNTISALTAAMHSTGQFLRLADNTQNYQIIFGTATLTSIPDSDADRTITLAQTFSTAHVIFLASVLPGTSWTGVYIRGTQAATTSSGNIRLVNGGGTQNFTVYYLAIGY